MAGPWFAVLRSGGDWQTLDRITLSNGRRTDRAVVQSRIWFADQAPEQLPLQAGDSVAVDPRWFASPAVARKPTQSATKRAVAGGGTLSHDGN